MVNFKLVSRENPPPKKAPPPVKAVRKATGQVMNLTAGLPKKGIFGAGGLPHRGDRHVCCWPSHTRPHATRAVDRRGRDAFAARSPARGERFRASGASTRHSRYDLRPPDGPDAGGAC